MSPLKSLKKRIGIILTVIKYACKQPKSEIKNVLLTLQFANDAKNYSYINVQNGSSGLGLILGVLVNYQRQVFPKTDKFKYVQFCHEGLSKVLLKDAIKPTVNKRTVKRRVVKRRVIGGGEA